MYHVRQLWPRPPQPPGPGGGVAVLWMAAARCPCPTTEGRARPPVSGEPLLSIDSREGSQLSVAARSPGEGDGALPTTMPTGQSSDPVHMHHVGVHIASHILSGDASIWQVDASPIVSTEPLLTPHVRLLSKCSEQIVRGSVTGLTTHFVAMLQFDDPRADCRAYVVFQVKEERMVPFVLVAHRAGAAADEAVCFATDRLRPDVFRPRCTP